MRTGAVKVIGILLVSALFVIGLSVAGYCGGNTEGGNPGGGNQQLYNEKAPTIEGVLTLTQVPSEYSNCTFLPASGPGPGAPGQAFYTFSGTCNNNKIVTFQTDPNDYCSGLSEIQFKDSNGYGKPLKDVTEADLVEYTTTVIPPGCGAPGATKIILKMVKSFVKDCPVINGGEYCTIKANVTFFNLVPR